MWCVWCRCWCVVSVCGYVCVDMFVCVVDLFHCDSIWVSMPWPGSAMFILFVCVVIPYSMVFHCEFILLSMPWSRLVSFIWVFKSDFSYVSCWSILNLYRYVVNMIHCLHLHFVFGRQHAMVRSVCVCLC